MTRTMNDHLREATTAIEEAKRGIEEAETLLRDAVKQAALAGLIERPDTAARAMHDSLERWRRGASGIDPLTKARAG